MKTAPVTYRADDDGLGWIVFDDPESRVNVFNPSTRAAFEEALTAATVQPPKALIITSGKERIFIAGADLKWLQALESTAAATEFSRHGQKLFERLACFPFP